MKPVTTGNSYSLSGGVFRLYPSSSIQSFCSHSICSYDFPFLSALGAKASPAQLFVITDKHTWKAGREEYMCIYIFMYTHFSRSSVLLQMRIGTNQNCDRVNTWSSEWCRNLSFSDYTTDGFWFLSYLGTSENYTCNTEHIITGMKVAGASPDSISHYIHHRADNNNNNVQPQTRTAGETDSSLSPVICCSQGLGDISHIFYTRVLSSTAPLGRSWSDTIQQQLRSHEHPSLWQNHPWNIFPPHDPVTGIPFNFLISDGIHTC